MANSSKFRILLLGVGTVGGAVLRILERSSAFEVVAIMSRNASERLKNQAPIYLSITPSFDTWHNLREALEQETIGKPDAVVELLGGTSCSEIYRYFLERGIPMVTANKALLAEHGIELFPLAQKKGTSIAAEASCGGGIPILQTLLYGFDQIHEFHGVLNGTCNYILSRMSQEGRSYSEILSEAQSEGLAEADPFLDVSGIDTAHKLIILAMMSFDTSLRLEDIPVQGIEGIIPEQIQAAEQLGLSLKLVASAHLNAGRLAMRVGPYFIARQNSAHNLGSASPLAELSSSFNGISFYGENTGHIYLQGRGAGASATASAVLSDLQQLASGAYSKAFRSFSNWPAPEKLQKGTNWYDLALNWLIFSPSPIPKLQPELLSLKNTTIYLLQNTTPKAVEQYKNAEPMLLYIPILQLPEEKLRAEM